ncbi:cytochrome P450 [Rhizophagus irregularis]|uniref:Cytochrome P450 n=2 Tax=Rhizophagus irregularis TaxID=588596 RepID=A0A2I1E9H8_9GLOM|nr:C-22 sterol desaturase [Rhizophagus irregularis DAOM 197198w]PKC15142.1 cytochrome P450 [Rhizophagus irregularis]PKC61209.1 cytochrome P450 [Rhizophagus irregularis]PKK72147.1 cytochrome P450 [Rhizophagus irregularis]PKY18794.1 cytochrome P450 [Rhizophagus irregularis]
MGEYLKETSVFQTYIVGIIILIIFYIIKRPRIAANEPPLVPYTIPILGHTYNYLFNTQKFLKECKEQYGECFSVYVFGYVVTVVSRDSLSEVLINREVFELDIFEILPFNMIFENVGDFGKVAHINAKLAREKISAKIEVCTPVIRKYIVEGIDKWIGDCKEPKEFRSIWSLTNNIIALPVANIMVGEEAASHEDVTKSLGDFAFDIGPLGAIPPVFSFIHPKLHEFVITLPLRFGWNPVARHRKIIINQIKPVIEKRIKEKKTLGKDYKPYVIKDEFDALEYYMSQPDFDYSKLHYYVDALFVLTFGAIGTTSGAVTNGLFDMAGRPDCFNELYEEAMMIDKECNGSIGFADVQKMKKLDSFVKEVLRHSDDTLKRLHKVISESYTFSNGYTVPKGRRINLYVNDALKSKDFYGDDADEFKPFRFVNENSPATKVDRNYVVFGGGKHACPGRFFAIHEAKIIFHKLILRYNIKTKSGKIENKTYLGPSTLPPRGSLIFENRK